MVAIDMEMPTDCYDCRFRGDYFCYAMPNNFTGFTYEIEGGGKPEWCPLIEGYHFRQLPTVTTR